MIRMSYTLLLLITAFLFIACDQFRYESYEPETTAAYYSPESPFVIISPSYKEQFRPGSDLIVKWDTYKPISSVRIDLYKSTTFLFKLTSRTENLGEFKWRISPDLKASVKYNVKISNADDESEYVISYNFGIYE